MIGRLRRAAFCGRARAWIAANRPQVEAASFTLSTGNKRKLLIWANHCGT
jgi:hypothetical protein